MYQRQKKLMLLLCFMSTYTHITHTTLNSCCLTAQPWHGKPARANGTGQCRPKSACRRGFAKWGIKDPSGCAPTSCEVRLDLNHFHAFNLQPLTDRSDTTGLGRAAYTAIHGGGVSRLIHHVEQHGIKKRVDAAFRQNEGSTRPEFRTLVLRLLQPRACS